MTKQELLSKIEELEKRVSELEARQPIVINYPQPMPPIPFTPQYPAYIPWTNKIICSNNNWPNQGIATIASIDLNWDGEKITSAEVTYEPIP
jgi:hypothetical protein